MLKNTIWRAARICSAVFWIVLLFLPAVSGAESFREFARAKSIELAQEVEPALSAFLKDPSPSTLYSLRKILRNNLAASYDTFYQAYPVNLARKYRHDLIEIDLRLGALRDLDVIAEQLAGPFRDTAGSQECLKTAEKERQTLMAAFIKEMQQTHSSKILSAAGFLISGPPPDGFYSNEGEFWEKPQVNLEKNVPDAFREMTDYIVKDIRKHGYSPESMEEFHLTRAKLRGLLSLLYLSTQKDDAPLAAVCSVLKNITGIMGDGHDRLVLKEWLHKKVPEDSPLAKPVDTDMSRLEKLARRQSVILDKSGLLEELVKRWPGLGEPFSMDASVLDLIRQHADKIHTKAKEEGRSVTGFSMENLPQGIGLIEFISAFYHFRPELEAEGWVETSPGTAGIDHGRKSLFHANPQRPVPEKITGKIEYLDEKGTGISAKPRLLINGVKYKQRTHKVPKILAFKASNMDADILAAELFRTLGMFAPDIFPAYIRNDDGAWQPVLLERWLNDEYVGEKWSSAEEWHAKANAEDYLIMRVVDVLTGNWDRHLGNWFVTQSGKVIPIDHDLAFVSASLVAYQENDWYVNFTTDIPVEPDFSPNIYIDAASPYGCPPKNGGIHRILRREKVPVLETILEKNPDLLLKAAEKVTRKLSPEKIRKAVDDIPLVLSGPERRKELAEILISRRDKLMDACKSYLDWFRKARDERAAFASSTFASPRETPRAGNQPDNQKPGFETEKKYWFCHGRSGSTIVDTYYRVGKGRSMRIRETEEGTFLTVKGPPSMEGTVKKRLEIEFPVNPLIREAFREADIPVVARVSKTRAEERRAGCKVLFDRVEKLGEFVEIECPSSDITAITVLEKELGISTAAAEERSYLELMTEVK